MQAAPWPFAFGIPHFDGPLNRIEESTQPAIHSGPRALVRNAEIIPAIDDRDHLLGDPEAPIQLVEYGDYTCPLAVRAHETVKALVRHFGSRLAFVFRHFPMPERRPMATLAAEAAEAAAEAGAFWKMHDRLLASPPVLDTGFLTWHAAAIGLDVGAFIRKLDLRVHQTRVAAHADEARRAGAKQPPTLFINGLRHSGPIDTPSLIHFMEKVRI